MGTPEKRELESEEDLVAHILSGSRQAEQRFYERYFPTVRLILERRTGNFADAQDLAQDTLLIVLRKLRSDGLEDPAALAAYIHRTAKYVFLGKARRLENRNESVPTDELDKSMSSESLDGYASAAREEAGRIVRSLLSELRQERDRDILTQHYILGISKPAVCENLQLTETQFDRVIYNARNRFRALFENQKIGFTQADSRNLTSVEGKNDQ